MNNPFDQFDAPSAAPPDVGAMVRAEAQRQGVDPDFAVRVAHQESGLQHDVNPSPKGAIGVMQLMPGTAAGLGVDPSDLGQNIQGGVGYLRQQLHAFGGDQRLAAAAYNAGPGAVAKYGGVPPFKETQDYVAAVAPKSNPFDQFDAAPTPPDDLTAVPEPPPAHVVVINPETGKPYNAAQQAAYAQLLRAGKLDPHAAPGSEAFPRGLTDPKDHAEPGTWFVDVNGVKRQQPDPSVLADAASGFAEPFQALGHDVMQNVRSHDARLARGGPPASLADAASETMSDLAAPFRMARDVLGLGGAPVQAVVRPLARQVGKVAPPIFSPPKVQIQGGRLTVTDPTRLQGDDRQAALEGMFNTALSAARPALPAGVPFGVRAPPPRLMTLDQLKAAKDAAYARVDASGYRFPQSDVQDLAASIADHVNEKGGPNGARLYPASTAMADRISALADQPEGVPLTQLDQLRSDIYGALVKPGDREAPIGVMMRQKIDGLINGSDAPDIQEARDLNTRLSKAQAITDKLDSAGLRSASTYSGGNYPNAVRQSLRPLVDPTSAQQINNLTPAERAALRRAVTGTPGQNLTRYASKLLTNKMVQAPMAVLTHGAAPAVMEAGGTILNKIGESQTQKAVQNVLDLISRGAGADGIGAQTIAPAGPWGSFFGPPPPPIVEPTSLLSRLGASGASVIALPRDVSPAGTSAAQRRKFLGARAR